MNWTNNLNITQSEEQGRVPVTVLHVEGRINLGNSGDLEQAAQGAYAKGARYILLDLSGVQSLTSAGLRSILSIYKMMNQSPAGADAGAASPDPASKSPFFKILNVSPETLRVLRMAGFETYIDIYDDRQEAISAF